jgi:hypothetical protein
MSVTVDAPGGIFLPANYPELISPLIRAVFAWSLAYQTPLI